MTNNVVNLVQRDGQKAFTTSLIIAEGCDNRSHESTIKLIRKYKSEFEQLGQLDFKSELMVEKPSDLKSRGLIDYSAKYVSRETEYAILNEDQATFLVTLFRNTPTVLAFKLNLVKAFRAALTEISHLYSNPPRTGLLTDKRKSMWDMTDALKEIRAELGKETEAKDYMCENKLINWCITGKFAKLDEKSLTNSELEICKKLRVKNAAYIRADMEYAERKAKLKEYAGRLRELKLLNYR